MNKISKILWATLLIILGIVVGLNSFNIININIFFNGFWTFFIIIPCIIDLFNKKRIKFDIIGIIVGFFLLLICLNIINLSLIIKLLIPLILILLGISLLLGGTIFIIYKNNKNTKEEVVDIFKEEKEEVKEDKKEDKTTKVIVDIKGMVVNPGVYEVDSTSRVNDVISLAGGLLEGADTSKINLAKVVEDEMTIIIYSTEEVLEKFREENCVCEKCDITNDACISSTATDNQLININTADEKELQNINGVGEAKAKSIIEYREENGLFTTIEDIKNVPGIGDSLFEKIKTYITI